MAAKQLMGIYAPDGSQYICLTNGSNILSQLKITKQLPGLYALDGSKYSTQTDGTGTLT